MLPKLTFVFNPFESVGVMSCVRAATLLQSLLDSPFPYQLNHEASLHFLPNLGSTQRSLKVKTLIEIPPHSVGCSGGDKW